MKKTSVESFIKDKAERILHQTKWLERSMVNSSVTLRKRLRDMTDDDRTGFFNPTTNNWVSIDLPNLYSWNIVKPTIRGNKSSMITARVKVDIEPRFTKDTVSEMAAQVAAAIIEQKERLHWTTELEERIADEQQIGAGVFIRTRWNPHINTRNKVAKWEEREDVIPGRAVCGTCGMETEVPEVFSDDGFAAIPCECGGEAQVIENATTEKVDVMTGYEEHSFGDIETTIHPFWNFRCDNVDTQGGKLDAASWFEHHYYTSLDEVQLEYPESAEEIEGSKSRMSYALRWQLSLQLGNTMPVDATEQLVDEYREIRDIYLTPEKYLNWQASENFELKSKNGKVRFRVKAGQNFKDAMFEGEKFEEPPVLCFRLCGESLLDVFPCDFRKEFQYATFLTNPSSFWGLFYTELLSLQDIVNYMLTLQVYHIRRNAQTSIVYNKGVFDPDDFEEDLIPTKEEFPYDFPIGQQYGIIPALTLSQEPMQMMQMVIQGKGDVTQVQPAMVGQAQPGETYRGQLLQKQQSLGLLAPASLSKAKAKVAWAKHVLNLVREHWTDEDGEELLRLNGEWTEEFIEAFLNCDLDRDLTIDFVQGSEIPRSLLEREVALRQFMMDVMGLAQINPNLIKEETLNDILMQLSQMNDIDIDVNNTESDIRLAAARFDKIQIAVESLGQLPPDPMVIDEAVSRIIGLPDLQPLLFEGHTTHIEFYSDKQRNESAQEAPNYVMIGCLNGMIDKHEQRIVQQMQKATMMQMAGQAPMMQAQQQQQEQMMQGEVQAQAEQRQLEAENKQRDRQAQLEDKAIDMVMEEQKMRATNGKN